MVSVASTEPSSRRAVTYPLNPLNGPWCTSTVCAPGGAVEARSSDGAAARADETSALSAAASPLIAATSSGDATSISPIACSKLSAAVRSSSSLAFFSASISANASSDTTRGSHARIICSSCASGTVRGASLFCFLVFPYRVMPPTAKPLNGYTSSSAPSSFWFMPDSFNKMNPGKGFSLPSDSPGTSLNRSKRLFPSASLSETAKSTAGARGVHASMTTPPTRGVPESAVMSSAARSSRVSGTATMYQPSEVMVSWNAPCLSRSRRTTFSLRRPVRGLSSLYFSDASSLSSSKSTSATKSVLLF
mmetsp:Transcript_8953/g.37920  ORF Transcript_8953/g.37920 Transcript_8953/m.37920 type:complete len:305 (-) Transcript_8953:726-1640(-)